MTFVIGKQTENPQQSKPEWIREFAPNGSVVLLSLRPSSSSCCRPCSSFLGNIIHSPISWHCLLNYLKIVLKITFPLLPAGGAALPPAAGAAAARNLSKPSRPHNKRRAEKQRRWRENCSSKRTAATPSQQYQQPPASNL